MLLVQDLLGRCLFLFVVGLGKEKGPKKDKAIILCGRRSSFQLACCGPGTKS